MICTSCAQFGLDGDTVFAEAHAASNEIELRARGPKRDQMLDMVYNALDDVNHAFGLDDKVEKRVPCLCSKCHNTLMPEFYTESSLRRQLERRRLRTVCGRSMAYVEITAMLDGTPTEEKRSIPDSERVERSTPALRTIKLFLASSAELSQDRDSFELYFRQQNDRYRKAGFYLEIIRWENFLDAMSSSRLQDEYNKAVRACDVFLSLFCTKTGKYTEEEFDTAFAQFQATGRPYIFTYFKDAIVSLSNVSPEELQTLWKFKAKLTSLGHYHTGYKDMEHLKRQFGDQLMHLRENGSLG